MREIEIETRWKKRKSQDEECYTGDHHRGREERAFQRGNSDVNGVPVSQSSSRLGFISPFRAFFAAPMARHSRSSRRWICESTQKIACQGSSSFSLVLRVLEPLEPSRGIEEKLVRMDNVREKSLSTLKLKKKKKERKNNVRANYFSEEILSF